MHGTALGDGRDQTACERIHACALINTRLGIGLVPAALRQCHKPRDDAGSNLGGNFNGAAIISYDYLGSILDAARLGINRVDPRATA